MKSSLKINAILILGVIAITFAIYSNIYNAPFVFDDHRVIRDRLFIRDLNNFTIETIFKSRGIVDYSFALNYAVDGLNTFGYHLVNIIIHAITGILVCFLGLKILQRLDPEPLVDIELNRVGFGKFCDSSRAVKYFIAGLTALIFVCHPIQTQAVTYTVQRSASLAALFYIASILAYIMARNAQKREQITAKSAAIKSNEVLRCGAERPCKKKKARSREIARADKTASGFSSSIAYNHHRQLVACAFFFLSALSGVLALLSKQNAASLPIMILLAEYIFFDRSLRGWFKKAPFFMLVFVLWFFLNLTLIGVPVIPSHSTPSAGSSLAAMLEDASASLRETTAVARWQYLCTQFNVIVLYIRLMIAPIGQNLDHFYSFKRGFWDGLTPLAFLLLVAAIGAATVNIRKRPLLSFGIFWFFVTLSVESSLIPIRDAMFEHRLYLPMFGFALAVSYIIFAMFKKKPLGALIIASLVVMLLCASTYARNNVWRDDVLLWSDVVAKAPHNIFAYNNLGSALSRHGRHDDAIAYYMKVLEIKPAHVTSLFNLGVAFEDKGDFEKAVMYYRQALEQNPQHRNSLFNMARIFHVSGQTDKALEYYRRAIASHSDDVESLTNAAVILFKAKEYDEAIRYLEKAESLNNIEGMIKSNLGSVYAAKGDYKKAKEYYRKALRLDGDDGNALLGLGAVYADEGATDMAIGQFEKVLNLKRYSAEAAYRIAGVYASGSDVQQALHWLKKASGAGFNQWNRLKNDQRFKSIHGTPEYRNFIAGQ